MSASEGMELHEEIEEEEEQEEYEQEDGAAEEDGGGGSFNDFASGLEEQMKEMMQKTAKAPKNAYEHWMSFQSAIDWSENWIRALLAFHVVTLILMLVFRKNVNFQTFLFFFLILSVYFSERANTYAAAHWREFSSQNYFDEHGVFVGLLFSGPILLILLCQLVNFLFLTSESLITAKRLQLKQQHR